MFLIDSKLKWKEHIHYINLKLSKGIGILSKLRHYVSKSTLRSLYYSFMHPFVNYNLLNWLSTPTGNLKSIRLSMRKALRVMSFKDKPEHSAPLFKNFEILPLDEFIKLKQAIMMWKLENELLPRCVESSFLKKNTAIVTRHDEGKFRIPSPRLDYAKRHITFIGVKFGNTEIPSYIKQQKTLKSFTSKFRQHLSNSN